MAILNEVWFDFDVDNGQVTKQGFLEIVKMIRIKEGIPDYEGSPFGKENLEKMFEAELQTDYEEENTEDLEQDHIWHYGVVCMLHDIMKVYTGSYV